MWKRIACLLLTFMMVFSLFGCSDTLKSLVFLSFVVASDDREDKDDIIEFVCENEETLLKTIKDGDFSAFENQGFIKKIDAELEVVDFFCGGAGIGSGTVYVGFFYTLANDMTAVWCAPSSAGAMTACADGYEWCEPNGDNRYYTEHICGNFYYYEASF